jgi:hypothetical protein
MTLNKRSLARAVIANKNHLESADVFRHSGTIDELKIMIIS